MNTTRSEASQAPRNSRVGTSATQDTPSAPGCAVSAQERFQETHTTTPRSIRQRRTWQPWEDAILRTHYPSGGTPATRQHLQSRGSNRTERGIQTRAATLNLNTTPGPKPTTHHGSIWSAREKRILATTYPTGGANATMQALHDAGYPARSRAAIIWQASKARQRTPTKNPLTPRQTDTLKRLAHATLVDAMPLDQINGGEASVLHALKRKLLAKHIGGGLWRATLAGIIEARRQAAILRGEQA